jgi:hypothetical protein
MPGKKVLTVKQAARLGGKQAARNMTPEQRSERARRAALARWSRRHAQKS